MPQAGKPTYLIANWKSHKTLAETEVFLQQFRGFREEGTAIHILCLPMPYLIPAASIIKGLHLPIKLGAQDISPYPFGAYTGAVSAGMLQGIVHYCIVGHSERRRYFHESNQDVVNKVSHLIEANITPIVCLDEPYIQSQLAGFDKEYLDKLIIAYEPLEAIGSGEPATPEQAVIVAKTIREAAQHHLPVLYGGSVTSDTIHTYTQQPELDGALVGGASLDLNQWKELLHYGSI